MKKQKISTYISLVVCSLSAVLLLVWLFTFPQFFHWFYIDYHGFNESEPVIRAAYQTVVICFYICAPFAAAALWMLISLLRNLLRNEVFIRQNVLYLRFVSWCCYAVLLATFFGGLKYLPLMIVAFAMGVTGTLLRVVKNVMHAAVVLREENDLTI